MKDCLFCKIINGDIPSYTIYEDEIVKSFLDINPITNGHVLIIPKKHYDNVTDIDLETLKHINKISKKIYTMLKEKTSCRGITFLQNNEYGQDVKHYHIHVIPRYSEDKLLINSNKKIINPVEETFNNIKKS